MPKALRILKWLGYGLSGLLAVVALGGALGYAWLRSNGGGDWLARQIEAAVSTPGEMELRIGALEGDLPAEIRLRDIALSDPEGDWLNIATLDVDWRPWDLLSRSLQIDDLALTGVKLARLPAAPAEAEAQGPAEAEEGGLPSLPLHLRISRLSADEIDIGEPVFGQAARFTLAGEATGQEDGRFSAGLNLARLDGPEGRLVAKVDYETASDLLTADVEAVTARGGLLAELLDIPDLPRAELRLAGSGPLADWSGDFAFSLEDMVRSQAILGLARGEAGAIDFRLSGHNDINPPAGDPAWDLLRGRSELSLAGSWHADRRLEVESFSAKREKLYLESRGSFDVPDNRLDLTLDVTAEDGALIARLLDFERLDRLAAKLTITGTLGRPEAQLDLQAGGIALPELRAEALNIAGSATAESDLLGARPRLGLDLAARIDAPLLVGVDEVNAVLDPQLPVKLSGSLDLNRLVLEIDSLEASQARAGLSASGPFNLESGAAQLQATLSVPDLAGLQPLTSIALGGRANLAGPVALTDFGSRIESSLKGRWDAPSGEIALLTRAAGKGMDIGLRLVVDGATVELHDIDARSEVAALSGALKVLPEPTRLDGRYLVTLAEAAALAEELGAELSGPARIEGEILGPTEAMQLNGNLQATQLTVEEQILRDLRGGYRLTLRGAEINGPVTLALASPFGPATAETLLKLREDAVTLAELKADVAETRLAGEVVVPLTDAAPRVTLDGEIASLAPWLTAAGLDGGGRGKLSLRLNVPGAAAPLLASAELSTVTLLPEAGGTPLDAERLTFELRAQDPALQQPADIKLRGQKVTRDSLTLDRLELDGQGMPQDMELTLGATGTWVEALNLQAAARLRQEGESLSVTLRSAEGQAFGQPLNLRQATELSLAPGETRLQNLDLASGETRLTADARLDGEQVAVAVVLDGLPMKTVDAFWDSGLTGMVSARLDLEGPLAAPRGTAALTAKGLRPRGARKTPELELTTSADWQDGRIKLAGELGGAQLTAAQFSADAPLRVTADGAGLEVPEEGSLSGRASWSGDISTLLLFVPLPQHRIKGQAEVALDVGGTIGAPRLDGDITLSEGRYENLDSGTILRKLELAVEVAGDKVTLTRLSATDGAKGSLSGEGEMTVDPAAGFPFDIALALESFRAVERDEVTAIIGGTVKLDGTADAPRVEGRLTTETVEVSLATDLPPNVVTLDVIEIKNGVEQKKPEKEKAAPPVVAALDVIVDMPRRVFVRGRGLDSEWAGRISVQGPSDDPAITGEVNLVRGQMSVVGKTFKLDEGKVTLPSGAEKDPLLDVTASHKGKDLEVTAKMSGPITEPELELSSVPEVPRDEIISRVLFGKPASQLSAAEAAQLALAVRELTGSGGGTDVLGFARRTMGVDVLRVDTTEDGDAAVEAGKYLTDEIYVGVKQGATPESTGAEVEIELTPNITVETETSGSGVSKSGLRFQLDY